MKKFIQHEIAAARDHAMAGGMALHVCDSRIIGPDAPTCFKRSKTFAHLFDQSTPRLTTWAIKLGVRVIVIDREGTPSQHIDLCGKPLETAIKIADVAAKIRDCLAAKGGAA